MTPLNDTTTTEATVKTFQRALMRRLRLWQLGLSLGVLMRWAGTLLMAGLAYALLDAFMALGDRTRVVTGLSLAVILVTVGLSWWLTVLRLRAGDMAQQADGLLGGRRQPVLTALELNAVLGAEATAMQSFLVSRSRARALGELHRLPFRRTFPFDRLRRQGRTLAIQSAIAALVVLAYPKAARVLVARLAYPMRDIPPYSRYTFRVTPEAPSVVYGDDVELGVKITGHPVRKQVWFLVRHDGQLHRRACFQETDQQFAQRLEQVVSPVWFCFATGNARSPWQQIALQLQPEIATARVTLQSPAYAGRPPRSFFAGKEPIEGLPGSTLLLEVVSNRPLRDGVLRVAATETHPEEVEIAGRRVKPNTLQFEWPLQHSAPLEVELRDIQGTRMREPYRLRQTLLPDAPPQVALTEPGAFVLATPSIALPLRGEASDALGLQRVALVRTVVGFRDRSRPLALAPGARRHELSESLDLGRLGVEPGQVLEFYLEAADTNPSLLGVTASDISRVQIISDEEYAMMLRARSTLEEFGRRYAAIDEAMRQAREALRELRDRANAGADPQALAEAIEAAAKAGDKARELYEQLGTDFPIFDNEPRMSDLLKELAGKMREMSQGMRNLAAPYGNAAGVANSWLDALGAYDERFAGEMGTGETILSVARVMQMAMLFREAVMEQEMIVRALQRLQDDAEDERRATRLRRLAERQTRNRERLARFASELTARLADVDAEAYAELVASSAAFLEALAGLGVEPEMTEAARLAANQDRSQAVIHAERALELLRSLLSKCQGDGGMGDMCQNRKPSFGVQDPAQSALQQMYQALCMQFGQQQGGGTPGGMGPGGGGIGGGDPRDGYSTSGYSPLNLPIMGPSRSLVPGLGSGRGGEGQGAAGRAGGATTYTESESMSGESGRRVGSETIPLESVPEKYRDAVRRFYGAERVEPGQPGRESE